MRQAESITAEPPQATVLVLGVGGNVSQGILKALNLSRPRPRIVAACVDPYAMGLYVADIALISPYADDAGFHPWLVQACNDHSVDGVMSGVEPVLTVLSEHAGEIERATGARCVVSPPATLAVGQDKLETVRWLQRRGLPHPESAAADDPAAVERLLASAGYPLIAKPRLGKGSMGVLEIATPGDLEPLLGRPGYVLQQALQGEEFTAATFSDREGRLRGSVAMRRTLEHGTTAHAEVGHFPTVRSGAEEIAAALRPIGPANVQLRLHEGRPVPFEINVRFSGTAPIRARLGFNDVEAALRHIVLGEPARDLPDATPGHAVRYWNESYVEADAVRSLLAAGEIDPRASPTVIEDLGIGPA